MDIFVVDAFTDQHFSNSAAIMPVTTFPEVNTQRRKKRITYQKRLLSSVTAIIITLFVVFTTTEIDFCGHAYAASAFVLYEYYNLKGKITFTTEHVGDIDS